MAEQKALKRQKLILDLLNEHETSFEEIADHISKQQGLSATFSRRTLQRDIQDIEARFGVVIHFHRDKNCYALQKDANTTFVQHELFKLDLLEKQDAKKYIQFDQRPIVGKEYLEPILQAIQERKVIRLRYDYFWKEGEEVLTLEPYFLKEFKYRWYLIAGTIGFTEIYHYGLERIRGFQVLQDVFVYPSEEDLKAHYGHAFGIVGQNEDSQVETILLSFTPLQGKYIKTSPLHSTQKVLIDNEKECYVSLEVFVAHDLIMELLSFGDAVEVIAPAHLRETIQNNLKRALSKYFNKNDKKSR